jgi:hypothetical protein
MRVPRLRFLILFAFAIMICRLLYLWGDNRQPVVALMVLNTSTNEHGVFAFIRLTNAGPRAIEYDCMEGDPDPLWYWRFGGAFVGPERIIECAFSLREHLMKPRETVDFKVPIAGTNKDCNLAVSYCVPTAANRLQAIAPYWILKRLPSIKDPPTFTVSIELTHEVWSFNSSAP